ncbi:endonuclease [Nocardioides abyssi]|uniref:Endonuclease n=1 Tax=Nocardioides abyssi TaxID=3058370 RepID=A0ABT8EPD6_9ACTN|nr:endonuclease [Nocardioides abyssi]MDN4159984.1 endonuclease [Nocardioides abyssi]
MSHRDTARVLLEQHGTTYAEDAGITVDDKPAALWQLLVLSLLLSARISSSIAVAAARELFDAGCTTPERTRDTTWQQRVDALGRGGYRRYDERTSTQLGELADKVLDDFSGDLRRMHEACDDVPALEQALQQSKGIGPAGAAIFLREVQGVWPDVAPYVDDLAAKGADRLGLPTAPEKLADLVPAQDLPRLVAACVRAARDQDVVDDVTGSDA